MIDENDKDRDDDREHDDDTGDGEETSPKIDPNNPYAHLSDEEAEAKARKQGWRPESEWDDARAEREGRRKPARFQTAREYLERIDKELPMMRDRYRKSEQTVAKLERQVGELTKQTSELSQLLKTQHNMSLEAKKKAYQKGIDDAKAARRAAATEGDTAAYDKAEESIEQLETEKAELEKAAVKTKPTEDDEDDDGRDDKDRRERQTRRDEPEVDEETKDWIDANKKWFQRDAVLNATMIDFNAVVRREHPDWGVTEQLEEAKKRTMEKWPEKFGRNPNRGGNGAVSSPSGGDRGAGKDSKRFDALPSEAKAAYEKYKKMFGKDKDGKEYSKEQYLADYHDA